MIDCFDSIVNKKKIKWQSFYDEGMPLSIPEYTKSPAEWFSHWVSVHPAKNYIFTEKGNMTYETLDKCACQTANLLSDLGVNKGSHIAVVSTNNPIYLIIIQALFKLGAVEVCPSQAKL